MTSRVTINSAGVPKRVALKNPPHFRTGRIDAPAADRAAVDAIRALTATGIDRTANFRSNGARPPAN